MYYKTSHRAFYVQRKGKLIRLGRTKEEAEATFSELDQPSPVVAVAVERFLEHHSRGSKPSTLQFYRNHLKPWLKCTLRVSELRAHHLTDILDQYSGRNYKHNLGRATKTCFRWLAENGIISQSPFGNVKLPPAVPRDDSAYIEPARWTEIIGEIADDGLRDILTFLAETGCRPQEARHLERGT